MSWSSSRPNGGSTAAKYRTAQHRRDRADHIARLRAVGHGLCAEPVCLMRSRTIVPGMKLDLCHDRPTGAVLGLGHARCNRSEASRYARAKQNASRLAC